MSEQQSELFDYDADATQLLEHMDKLALGELEHQWPQQLVALIDVMEAELQRQGHNKTPRDTASKLVLAISHYMGGRSHYLPMGEKLKQTLRDDMIYCQFNGRNIEELRRHHGLSQPQIYLIIAQQRKLHTRRHQPDLFPH